MNCSSHQRRTGLRSLQRYALVVMGGVLALGSIGCYDGQQLVERVRNKAIQTRLIEVDLGKFRVTLPRDERTSVMTEVDLHLFGHAKRYEVSDLKRELQEKEYAVHDQAIHTLRSIDPRALVDPNLVELRNQLETTVNTVLTDASISSVGFYNMRLVRH